MGDTASAPLAKARLRPEAGFAARQDHARAQSARPSSQGFPNRVLFGRDRLRPNFSRFGKLERNRVDGALRLARSGAPGNEPAAHKILCRPRQPAEPENNSAANTADGRWPKPVGEKSADRRSDELAETRLAVPTVKKKGKAASLVLLRIRKVTIAGVATRPSPTRTRCSKT
jgi:hypothetical protein